ncbi:type I restriction enzyme endonuclease domain-containing protein [Nostoc sp.]|uniref:type I restriction enzyme endonuclease domain-containing protein n=1 Tax=Nostoc sp. TaxID=1180 RepID=UPI002FF60771
MHKASIYDRLIDNNNRRIALLEESIHQLYKKWFVRLRFPGYESVKVVDGIPEGWKVSSIGNLSEVITRGITPKYDSESKNIVLNQKCIRNYQINFEFVRQHHSQISEHKKIIFGDVLINSTGIGTLGRVAHYMDKPLQGHNLMQTIARANRVHEGKNNGLLIDYNGILKALRAALARYARTDVDDSNDGILPYNDLNQLQADYATALDACINHIASLGFDLQELVESTGFDKISALVSAVNAVCTNDESRARFDVLAREVFKKKQALITEPKLTAPYQDKYNAIEAIQKHLQEQHKKSIDINAVLYSLQNVVSDLINVDTSRLPGADSGKIYNISKIDFDVLKAEFANSPAKNISVQSLKEAVERQLHRMLKQNPSRIDYYACYQQIIQDYNRETDRVTIEQTFEELLKLVQDLSEEDTRAVREGLSEEHLAVFDLLCASKDNLDARTRNRVKQVAQLLIQAVKVQLKQLENWRDKESTKATIKSFIYDYLYSEDSGLPIDAYDDSDVDNLSNVVFLHVYQQYESADNHPYAA